MTYLVHSAGQHDICRPLFALKNEKMNNLVTYLAQKKLNDFGNFIRSKKIISKLSAVKKDEMAI